MNEAGPFAFRNSIMGDRGSGVGGGGRVLSYITYTGMCHPTGRNGVSILGGFLFLSTGCQFGVPGGTYQPKKYPGAPPGHAQAMALSGACIFRNSNLRFKPFPVHIWTDQDHENFRLING